MRIKDETLIGISKPVEPLLALERLEQLVPTYALNKSELDDYKKLCEKENAEIKALMTALNVDEKEVGGYKVTKTVQKRESMNEEVLLEIAHYYGLSEIIKTKEYIDFEVLENALYNNLIPKNVLQAMDKAKDTKEVTTLRVKKLNKKEEK